LTRRGLALSAAFLVSALSNGTVIADVVPPQLVKKTVSGAMVIVERIPLDETAISPEVSQLMGFAAATPWASRAAIAGVLLAVILGALASLGLTVSPRSIYGSDLNLGAFFRPAANRSAILPAPASPCATAGECASTGCAASASTPAPAPVTP
jgi:hypothetical protein